MSDSYSQILILLLANFNSIVSFILLFRGYKSSTKWRMWLLILGYLFLIISICIWIPIFIYIYLFVTN